MSGALMLEENSDYQKLLAENNRMMREIAELRRKLAYYESARTTTSALGHGKKEQEREKREYAEAEERDVKIARARHARAEERDDSAAALRRQQEQQRRREQEREQPRAMRAV